MVGCVLVKKGRIVAEGYHARFGGPHAEMSALEKAGARAKGSTAYLNLEPCIHWGKQPPCAPALLHAGIKEVFISHADPNPLVHGEGIKFLKRNRVRVHLGLEEKAARHLNRAFLTWKTKARPYVILKMAMSLDGKIATARGDSKWISGPAARNVVHQLRAESDAIVIGANTARHDNPLLTSHGAGRNPLRVVVSQSLDLPTNLKLMKDRSAQTCIMTSDKSAYEKSSVFQKTRVFIVRTALKKGRLDLKDGLKQLSKINVSQILLEGGGETAWAFISQGLVDEVLLFVAPKLIGGRLAPSPISGDGFSALSEAVPIESVETIRLGDDLMIRGLIH